MATGTPSLPSNNLLESQARWLAPARSRLLRRGAIAHRRSVLDLGAGRGTITPELARRSNGPVYALDLSQSALCEVNLDPSTVRIVGNIQRLPFPTGGIELAFSQFTLLWVNDLERTIDEIWRVLTPGGHFCAIEPDYQGLVEYPSTIAVANIWRAALARCGATPDIGRRLPGMLERQGFKLQVRLLDQLLPPSPLRFAMLQELPLEPGESASVAAAEKAATALSGWQQVAHLPLFLINASRPG